MARLLRTTARVFARPKYLITDLGGEFTAGAFRNAIRRLGAVQRSASKDSLKATARLERFWSFGLEPAHLRAVDPPRGRPGDGPILPPFQIEYLDPLNRRLPVFDRAA